MSDVGEEMLPFFVNSNLSFVRGSLTGALMLIQDAGGNSRLGLFGKLSTDLTMFSALLFKYRSSVFPIFWSIDVKNVDRKRWEDLFKKIIHDQRD